jgi:hypothetical protein
VQLKRPRSDDIPRGAAKTLLVSPMRQIKSLGPELMKASLHKFFGRFKTAKNPRIHGPVKDDVELDIGMLSISDLWLLRNGAKM